MTRTGLLIVFALWSVCASALAQVLGDPVFAPYRERVDVWVENELEALAREQKSDGYFDGQYGTETGTVSLVGMAFLAKGHLPGQGVYGNNVNRAIDCILAKNEPNGLLATPSGGSGVMYSHSISTLFLSEVSGMVDGARQIKINEKLPRALRLLLDAQSITKPARHQGGWRYQPGSADSDLSVAGWAVMSLRSAKSNGAPVPDRSVEAAIDYVKHCYVNGSFAYMPGSRGRGTLDGVGVLCLELSGMHGSKLLAQVGDSILENPHLHTPYSLYYEAQAMFQLGGRHWKGYADKLYPLYLDREPPRRRAVYERALILLALSVPYRQLPIYQRDETLR